MKFYGYVFGSLDFKEAHGSVSVKGDFAIGKIVAYHYIIPVRKVHY